MAGQFCDNCVYSVCDPQAWHRSLWMGESIVPRCANHPQWPGQLHDVPGVPCRNYRPRPVLPDGDGVPMIPLGDGFYAYVDAADYEWLSRHNWRHQNGYAVRNENGRRVFMHRQIMQPPKGMVVDHFDGNRANNCRVNLHVCTPDENRRNRRGQRNSRSRFKGVYWHKLTRKWCAKCQFEGKRYYLGVFDDEVEAARAYDRKAVELFGEYARLNFPDEWPPERRAEVYAQRDAAKREGRKAAKKQGKRATGHGRSKVESATARQNAPRPRAADRVRRPQSRKRAVNKSKTRKT